MTDRIEARKALGQHFLVNPRYCRRIVEFAGVCRTHTVLEIGPGTGRLTEQLLTAAGRVIAVELDTRLVGLLRGRWSEDEEKRLSVIEGDILELSLAELLPHKEVVLVANLPYGIATAIIEKMTEVRDWFQSMTVMVQREVAERLLAKVHERQFGYFSTFAQYHYVVQRGFDVPPGAFSPAPSVVSTVIQLVPRPDPLPAPGWDRLAPVLRQSFRYPRKTLFNNLKAGPSSPEDLIRAFEACGLERSRRPHQVSLQEFCCLAELL